HTRFSRDWSSDVCSSDLHLAEATRPDQIEIWQKLGIHKNHIQRLRDFHLPESQLQFQHCVALIHKHSDFILTLEHPDYPTQLLPDRKSTRLNSSHVKISY